MEFSTKKCSKCKQLKSTSEYSKCKTNKDGLQFECKSCAKERRDCIIQRNLHYFNEASKKYRDKHQIISISKKIGNPRYIQFPKDSEQYNKELIVRSREASKKYRQTHSDKYKLRANEKYNKIKNNEDFILKRKERNRLWYINNIEKSKINFHKRRAAIKGAGGNHTKEDIKYIFNSQNGKCAICKESIKNKKHIDHIIPISNNGSNDKYNIQLLCPSCNLRKHNKDPIYFMQSLGFLL